MTEAVQPPRPWPLWARLASAGFLAVLVPVYWHHYGPANFLWFSDIALFAVTFSLWTGARLPYSMMAIGVLPLELAWVADFLSGGTLIGLAGYMFDDAYALYLRALSLFHLALPPLVVWMLWRDGYDPRALAAQTVLALAVLPASWLLAGPEENVNWVYGFGEDLWRLPGGPLGHLVLLMALLPAVVYLPVHLLLRRIAGRRGR